MGFTIAARYAALVLNLLLFSFATHANPVFYLPITGPVADIAGTTQAGSTINTGPNPQSATFSTALNQASANTNTVLNGGDVLVTSLQASATSSPDALGQSGTTDGDAQASFYVEVVGPDNGGVRGELDLTLNPVTLTRSGGDFPYPGQCFTSLCVNLSYGYTIIDVNGGNDCSGIVANSYQCGATSTIASSEYFGLNTPTLMRLSATAVVTGQAAAAVDVGINMTIGIETALLSTDEPQGYTVIVGPSIASLTPIAVPEPASFVMFGIALCGFWLCRRPGALARTCRISASPSATCGNK